MNFDPLSFAIGKHGDSGPVRDVVSYLIGRAGEVWQTLTDVAVATFTTVSTSLRELVIDITPVQAAGTPTPENPLPISGWMGANIYRGGENLLDGVGVAQGNLTSTGGTQSSNKRVRTPFVAAAASTAYSVALGAGFVVIGAYFYTADNTSSFISREVSDSGLSSFTTPATAAYVRFVFAKTNTDANVTPEELTEQRLVCVSSGYTSVNLPFPTPPGTIYGGTLTWLGGDQWKLTVTMVGIDLGTLTWTRYLETTVFISNTISGIKIPASSAVPVNALCDKLEVRAGSAGLAGSYCCNVDANGAIWARLTSEYTTSTAFTEGVTGTTFVYELAAPVEYTITVPDSEIKTLLGSNNIFADTGNINTITFRTH